MKSMVAFLSVVAAFTFFIVDCANHSEPQKFAYELSHDGCTTGHHEFASLQEMCAGVQDENFNNGCAVIERSTLFKKSCPGTFKPAGRSYSFVDNGCETGRHGFNSLPSMCKALQSDIVNNGCAAAQRESYFKQQCRGDFKGLSMDGTPRRIPIIRNLDCSGYVITEDPLGNASIQPISWSGRDLRRNRFPEVPGHSSIVLSCTRVQ